MDYKDLPQHKIFADKPIFEIPIEVRGSGFKLLSANFSKRNLSILVDNLRSKKNAESYILLKEQRGEIQKQLHSGLQLQKFLSDTIFLNLGTLKTKKVPIVVDKEIDFQLGYDLASSIKTIPDSIIVSGPDAQLEAIKSVKTKKVVLEEVSETQQFKVDVDFPSDNDKIKLSHQEVEVFISVDKFTEGEVEVPFEIENLPKNVYLTTFPNKVKVVFKVGLGNFNKITADTFKVTCNYESSKENGLSYLIPKVDIKSNLVQIARVSPSKIDFLIQK